MPRPSEPPVDLLSADDPVAAFRAADAADAPVRLRTSGSSSEVVRTTASWTVSFGHVSRLAGIVEGSRVWVPGPVTASMNVFARVHAAYVGAAVVDDPAGPGGAGHAVLTPAQLTALLDLGAPSGMTVVVAGDRLARSLHDRAVGAGLVVHHYYGATELSFVAWGAHAEDLWPFPGTEVRVEDGEIAVRSPYLCRAGTGRLRRLPDGFATVGDRGALVAGRLRVDGRPGTVTTGGATVLVADVEGVLRPLATGEVVVTGTPHERLGAVLTAVLTDAADRWALAAASRDLLPAASRPRRWVHVPDLPRTGAGKVDRDAVARIAGSPPPRPGGGR